MKAKSLLMTLALGAMALTAGAQDKPAYKTSFDKDGAAAHWFLEVGDAAVVNFLHDNENKDLKFGDRITYINPTLALGKWFNPYFAIRLKGQGGEAREYVMADAPKAGQVLTRNTYTYVNGHLDFMFDVVNYFAPYRESRVFHLIPYLGIGAGWVGNTKLEGREKVSRDSFLPQLTAGLQFKFRLAKRVDLNFDVNATGSTSKLYKGVNGEVEHVTEGMNLLGSAEAGLTFHLGKKEFTPVVPMDVALINDLNGQVNRLRAENAELAKRPEYCPECPEVGPAGVVVGNVVYFRLNSAKIDANQMVNIYNTAEWAKNNTETITLVGYADRETGNPEYNMDLSRRRAEAVKDVLVKKYGISEDRIKISWKGDTEQPYAENVWNRIVIMNAEVK